MKIFIAVFVGGGLGSLLRYSFQYLLPSIAFPWPTLTANIFSCFIVGLILSQPFKINDYHIYKTFIITGFCGGLSTFSGFIKDEYQFINLHEYVLTMVYCVLSFTLCFVSMFVGIWIGKHNQII